MIAKSLLVTVLIASAAAGCVKRGDEPVDTAAVADLLPALPFTEEIAGDVQVSVATPLRTVNNGGSFSAPLAVNETHTGFVVELVWEAASPAAEELSVWVREAGAGGIPPSDPAALLVAPEPLARVSGASPLRVPLPASAFPGAGEYEILVRAAAEPAGVALDQPFTLHVTTFDALPFDETFSAIEGAAGA